jgi:hypothetical protein
MVEVELGGGDGRGQGGDFSSTGGAETKGSASNIFNNKNVLSKDQHNVALFHCASLASMARPSSSW